MMLSAGVKPIIIFDGCRLEMKSNTEAERRKYMNLYQTNHDLGIERKLERRQKST